MQAGEFLDSAVDAPVAPVAPASASTFLDAAPRASTAASEFLDAKPPEQPTVLSRVSDIGRDVLRKVGEKVAPLALAQRDLDEYLGDVLLRMRDGAPGRGPGPRPANAVVGDLLSSWGKAAKRQANEERGVSLDPFTQEPLRSAAPKYQPDQVRKIYSDYEPEVFAQLRKADAVSTDEDITNRLADFSRRGDPSLITPELLSKLPKKSLPKHAAGESVADVAENIVRSGAGGMPVRVVSQLDKAVGGLQWLAGEVTGNDDWIKAGRERVKTAGGAAQEIGQDFPVNVNSKAAEYVTSGLDSIPFSLGGAGLWRLAGGGAPGTAAALTPLFLQQQGQTYGEMRQQNFGHAYSMLMSSLMGASEAGTEAIALPAMGKLLRSPQGKLIEDGLNAMWKEGGSEAINTVAQGVLTKASTKPNYSMQDLADDLQAAIVGTAITVPALGGVARGSQILNRALPNSEDVSAARAQSGPAPSAGEYLESAPAIGTGATQTTRPPSAAEYLDAAPSASPATAAAAVMEYRGRPSDPESDARAVETGLVDSSAHKAATSPQNSLTEPTPDQERAGNHQMGHERIAGLEFTFTHPEGATRFKDTDHPVVMKDAHYGYIKGTIGKDGDHIDAYWKAGTPTNYAGPVFVIDQYNPKTGEFDEHKPFFGVGSAEEAARIYDQHFNGTGPARRRAITGAPLDEFKAWVRDGDKRKPFAQPVDDFNADLVVRHPKVTLILKEHANRTIDLSGIQVKNKADRGEGLGSAAMRDILAQADRQGRGIILLAQPEDPKVTSLEKLVRWYQQFGFEPLSEQEYADATHMYREPKGAVNATTQESTDRSEGTLRGERPRAGSTFGAEEGKGQAAAQAAGQVTPAHSTASANLDDRRTDQVASEPGNAGRSADARRRNAASGQQRPIGGADKSRDGGSGKTDLDSTGARQAGVAHDETQVSTAGREDTDGGTSASQRDIFTKADVSREETPDGNDNLDPNDPGESSLYSVQSASRAYSPDDATTDIDVDLARPDAIRDAVRKLLNVPINERHLRVRRALGIYKVLPRTIRLKNQNDLDTLSHEVFHHFSETEKAVRALMVKHRDELLKLTPQAYFKESHALRTEEGFAEWGRLYLTQRSQAMARAPAFAAAFEKFIEGSKYRPIFDRIHQMVDDFFSLDPVNRIMAKVGARPRSIAERIGEVFDKDRFIWEVLDNWLPLKRMVADLSPNVRPSADPFKAAHLLSGDSAVIEDWLVSGTIPADPVLRADVKNHGKPLYEILKPVSKDLRGFSAYLIARRAAELVKHDKEHLFTQQEIDAGLKLETPQLRKVAEEIYDYNRRLVDYAVEGGFLSKDVADKFRQYTSYIPFLREDADEVSSGGDGGSSGPFKRLKGGTQNLRDPISNIIENTANVIYATNRNAVLVKAYQLAKAVPGGGKWLEEIPIPMKPVQIATEQIIKELEAQGVDLDPEVARDLAAMQTFFTKDLRGDRDNRTMIIKVGGEPKAIQVNSAMLWQALQAFEPIDLGLVGKALAIPSDLLRAGVTLSPEFMVRNFMRDTLSGFMQSKKGMIPIFNTIVGFKEVATRSDVSKLYRAFGGAHADLWKGDSKETRNTLERMAKRGRFDPRTILTPAGIINVLHRMGSISEAGTRVAEFKKTMDPANVDSLIEAAYAGREISVDFGMHGHSQTIRFLSRVTPFLNPALQGLYKAARTGQEQFFKTLLRGSVMTGFSVLLFLLNRDKDWYQEIEQWEKNVYWHVDVGLRSKDGGVIPLRIPKPFEWGAVFGSVPEAITQVAVDKNGKDFGDRLLAIYNDVFALRMVPTGILVPTEIWANKNSFTGRRIVPESRKNLDASLQYGNQTSLTAREVGGATGLAPAKVDHTIRGFSGTLGVYGTMLADQAVKVLGKYPDLPASTWRQMPVVRAFVHDPDNPNTRYINDFYDLLDRARRADASLKRYDGTTADAYYSKNKPVIDIAQDANRTAREMGKSRKEIDEIYQRRDLTPEQKRTLINERNREIKGEARNFMREAAQQGIK